MKWLCDNLKAECGYDDEGDTGVDSLIEYKNALEDLTTRVDLVLRQNAEGHFSAADVCAALWSMGFDPNEYGTPVPAEHA